MTSDNLDSKPTIEDVDFNHLICVAGGIIEDLKAHLYSRLQKILGDYLIIRE